MDQKTRSEILQGNEQIKALSGLTINIGTALLAAAATRWFFERFDENVIFWFVVGVGLIWSAVHGLRLLEAEA